MDLMPITHNPARLPIGSVLFAEADPRVLATFPALLAERLPKVQLEICNTVDEAARNLRKATFDTVIASTPFLWAQDSRLLKDLHTRHTLVPLVLTVNQSDRTRAQTSLQTRGFDLITKPIQADEAVKTVRVGSMAKPVTQAARLQREDRVSL